RDVRRGMASGGGEDTRDNKVAVVHRQAADARHVRARHAPAYIAPGRAVPLRDARYGLAACGGEIACCDQAVAELQQPKYFRTLPYRAGGAQNAAAQWPPRRAVPRGDVID